MYAISCIYIYYIYHVIIIIYYVHIIYYNGQLSLAHSLVVFRKKKIMKNNNTI